MKAIKITVDYLDRTVTLNGHEADLVMKKLVKMGMRGLKWKVKLKKGKAAPKALEPDLVAILDQFKTLQLVNDNDPKNIEFWEGHLRLLTIYFKSNEFQINLWLTKILTTVDFWQTNNPERQSRTKKGLRTRINTWLMKEYGKIEKGQR